ncbi:MAG: hypothetical protein NTZ68_00850 [Candidatus Dependentiae bacterium]|nr:hypothetical protein [Candidatus Dependentiae bacterium]
MKLFNLLIAVSLFCLSPLIEASYRPRKEDPRYRTIFVQTANNKKIPCSADQNIAYFFEQCRFQGDCKGQQLTLIFDFYEIKEGTPAANKRFNEYNTNSKEAFIQEVHDNRAASNNQPTQTAPTQNNEEQPGFISGVITGVVASFIWLFH